MWVLVMADMVVGHNDDWLNGQPDLSFCAGSVVFKTTVVSPGGVEHFVYLMHYQEAPLPNTSIEVSSALSNTYSI